MKVIDYIFPKGFYNGSDESRRFILHIKYLSWRYQHRKKLVRKWAMNTEFKKQSISGTWEVEFFNLVPEDDKWHQVVATVTAYVKKNKKVVRPDSEATQYIDGLKIAQVKMVRGENIEIGRAKK
jgi:adenine-specific DNA methylase